MHTVWIRIWFFGSKNFIPVANPEIVLDQYFARTNENFVQGNVQLLDLHPQALSLYSVFFILLPPFSSFRLTHFEHFALMLRLIIGLAACAAMAMADGKNL